MRTSVVLTFQLALALVCVGPARTQVQLESRLVDTFEIGPWRVEVRFFDPTVGIYSMYPRFDLQNESISVQQRSDMWADYLHKAPLYLFSAVDVGNNRSRHFCMRGDPAVRNSARFYKVEVFAGSADIPFVPVYGDSTESADDTIREFPVGGSLFEHMAGFQRPENAQLIGNGVQFLGYFRRVTPYAEIRSAMLQIIEAAQ